MKISILLFDGFTALDAVGGYEVLARIPGVDIEFVAAQSGVVAADTRRLGLMAYRSFDEVQHTDVLYVPGGCGAAQLEGDSAFLGKLRELDLLSRWTVGIGNGVGLLAAAGLLKGRKASTSWCSRERLAAFGAVFTPDRYFRSDKYITAAGVTASIDAALFLANLIGGEQLARTLQLGIEHYPVSLFPDQTPAQAPAAAHAAVRQFRIGALAMLGRTPPWSFALG